ncbi:hypothetical protein ACBR40_27200 [Nonomuraea sp. AD125B]
MAVLISRHHAYDQAKLVHHSRGRNHGHWIHRLANQRSDQAQSSTACMG